MSGHCTPHQSRWNKAVQAEFNTRHRKWPLGTHVVANTPVGRLPGKVVKHWRKFEEPGGCSIEFDFAADFGDANGARYSHVVPFRNLKKCETREQALHSAMMKSRSSFGVKNDGSCQPWATECPTCKNDLRKCVGAFKVIA